MEENDSLLEWLQSIETSAGKIEQCLSTVSQNLDMIAGGSEFLLAENEKMTQTIVTEQQNEQNDRRWASFFKWS